MAAKETRNSTSGLQGSHLRVGNKTTVTKMWWDNSHNWGKQWTGKNPSVQVDREEEVELVLSVMVQLSHVGILCGGRRAWLNRECLFVFINKVSLYLRMGFKNKENDQRKVSQGLLVSSRQAPGLHLTVLRKLADVLARLLSSKKALEDQGRSLTIGRKQMMHLSSVKATRIIPVTANLTLVPGKIMEWVLLQYISEHEGQEGDGELSVWFDQGLITPKSVGYLL